MLVSFVWFDDIMSITNGDYLNSFDVGMNSIGNFNRIVIEGCDDDVTLSKEDILLTMIMIIKP